MQTTLSTPILSAGCCDIQAPEAHFAALYRELRGLARRELARSGPGSTPGATSLLHEAYLDIAQREGLAFPDRARFLAYAARVMRGLIIDGLRRRQARNRACRRPQVLLRLHLRRDREPPGVERAHGAAALGQGSDLSSPCAALRGPPVKGERWLLVSPHLDQALELSGEERRRYLAGVASEDPALAADLELLLGEQPALHDEKYLEHDAQDLLAGSHLLEQVFGAYTLVSPLGAGGMGSVWLARRNDGRFEGTAAVKLLSAALLDTAGVSRFRREGTILARLKHPHIAQLIDAGVSAAGQPYLVLEYVEGEPIDRWCDKRRLDVESRVRLFL